MKLLEKPKFTTAHSRAGTKRALLGCAPGTCWVGLYYPPGR